MDRGRALGALMILSLVAGCSSSDDIGQQAKTAASAIATAQMAAEASLSGTAPSHYVRRTLRAVQEKLAGVSSSLRGATVQSEAARSLTASLDRIGGALGRAAAAAKDKDRGAIERASDDIGQAVADSPVLSAAEAARR